LIEGRSKAQTKKLMNEWLKGIEVARKGGTFEENLSATEDLRRDSFFIYLNGNSVPTKEGYLAWQKKIQSGENIIDTITGLPVYVPEFDKLLSKVNCPVLAIFGDKDCNVDWKKTLALYKRTISNSPYASLSTKVLPNCDHGMLQCKTGGIRENLTNAVSPDEYFSTMLSWLKEKGFGS
jgi:pimeloyl-ACP methyl ester carboxylesterase